jgi:hypothetical protein
MGQTESHVVHIGESSDGLDRVELYKHFTCQPPKDHVNHVNHVNPHALTVSPQHDAGLSLNNHTNPLSLG